MTKVGIFIEVWNTACIYLGLTCSCTCLFKGSFTPQAVRYVAVTSGTAPHRTVTYRIRCERTSALTNIAWLMKPYLTRRHSESAYIRQVNFLQLLCRVREGDGAQLQLKLYLKPLSKYRNNGHEIYRDHDLDLSRSRDVIDDVIIQSAIDHFLLVGNWYQVSISIPFQDVCI